MKDRVAKRIMDETFASGTLQRGGLITEGTVGSTGISLAMVAAARGVRCFVAMPDDAAKEKSQLLTALGEVLRVLMQDLSGICYVTEWPKNSPTTLFGGTKTAHID